MGRPDRKTLGRLGEMAAAILLEREGCTIVSRNTRISHAEIDIIAREADGTTVFVEVKTRLAKPSLAGMTDTVHGGSAACEIDLRKRETLRRAAELYASKNGDMPRIDVIEVYAEPDSEVFRVAETIRHIGCI